MRRIGVLMFQVPVKRRRSSKRAWNAEQAAGLNIFELWDFSAGTCLKCRSKWKCKWNYVMSKMYSRGSVVLKIQSLRTPSNVTSRQMETIILKIMSEARDPPQSSLARRWIFPSLSLQFRQSFFREIYLRDSHKSSKGIRSIMQGSPNVALMKTFQAQHETQ